MVCEQRLALRPLCPREFVAQLEENDKKFLIIGNTNAITYKETFKLTKEDKMRTGYTNFNVGMFFVVPDDWEKYHHIDDNGKKLPVFLLLVGLQILK
mgnify:CR=1 FL=1